MHGQTTDNRPSQKLTLRTLSLGELKKAVKQQTITIMIKITLLYKNNHIHIYTA